MAIFGGLIAVALATLYLLRGSAPEVPRLYPNVGQAEVVDGLVIDAAFEGRFSSRQEYLGALASELEECHRIPVFDGEFFNGFNPDGSGISAWNRSVCFQNLATEYMSADVCENVWQRYSPFRPSWQFSEQVCRYKVQHRRNEISRAIYQQLNLHRARGIRLYDLQVRKLGQNGGYLFDPSFSGEEPGRYRMRIYLLDAQGDAQLLLLRDMRLPNELGKYGLEVTASSINDVSQNPSAISGDTVVAVLTRIIDQFGAVDPGWINSTWPASTRSQLFKKELQF